MPELVIRLRIPFGDAGSVSMDIDITDLDQLTPDQRRVLADTGRDFFEFAAATLTDLPALNLSPPEPERTAAQVHDPNSDVLAGVTGKRRL